MVGLGASDVHVAEHDVHVHVASLSYMKSSHIHKQNLCISRHWQKWEIPPGTFCMYSVHTAESFWMLFDSYTTSDVSRLIMTMLIWHPLSFRLHYLSQFIINTHAAPWCPWRRRGHLVLWTKWPAADWLDPSGAPIPKGINYIFCNLQWRARCLKWGQSPHWSKTWPSIESCASQWS